MLPLNDAAPPSATDPVVGFSIRAFNWRLKKAKEATGLTLPQLYAKSGVGPNRFCYLQALRGPPTEAEADSLAALFGLPVDYLFPGAIDALINHRGTLEVGLTEAQIAGRLPVATLPSLPDPGLRPAVEAALGALTKTEQQVVCLRFGLDGSGTHSLGEIAVTIGRSRERVRQFEAQALYKLRQPRLSRRLREYVDHADCGDDGI